MADDSYVVRASLDLSQFGRDIKTLQSQLDRVKPPPTPEYLRPNGNNVFLEDAIAAKQGWESAIRAGNTATKLYGAIAQSKSFPDTELIDPINSEADLTRNAKQREQVQKLRTETAKNVYALEVENLSAEERLAEKLNKDKGLKAPDARQRERDLPFKDEGFTVSDVPNFFNASDVFKQSLKLQKDSALRQSILVKQAMANDIYTTEQGRQKLYEVDNKSYSDRISLADKQLGILRQRLQVERDGDRNKETIRGIKFEIQNVKAEADKQLNAQLELQERKKAEDVRRLAQEQSKTFKQLQLDQAAARSSAVLDTDLQIAKVKELGLTQVSETTRVTAIQEAASKARVKAVGEEITQILQARSAGSIRNEDADRRLIQLNSELGQAELQRVEATRAAERAAKAEIIAGIEEQQRLVQVEGNVRAANAERGISALREQQQLTIASEGLESSRGKAVLTQLDNQIRIAKAVGDENTVRSLTAQIQAQQVVAQERSYAAELKNLDITNQIKLAELERQKILDNIALKQEELNYKKLEQKTDVTKGELDTQLQIVQLAKDKLVDDDRAIALQNTLTQYKREGLLVDQQSARETLQTDIYLQNIKNNTAAIAPNFQAVQQSAIATNQAVGQLNQGITQTAQIVQNTDGSITQVYRNLTNASAPVNQLNQGLKTTAEIVKLADGSIVQVYKNLEAAATSATNLQFTIPKITENAAALASQAQAVARAFKEGATSFQGSATGLGGNIQTAARGADGIIGSSPGQTVAGKQAQALSAGLQGFEKQAFLFNAKAKEIKDAGLISSEKINIGGASFDYAEAGELFGRAASTQLDGLVSKMAQLELATKVAVAQTGSVAAGNNAAQVYATVARRNRENLTGKLETIPIEIKGFASGTRGQPIKSGIAMVGEKGAELINVTPQGTHVLSNRNSAKFMGGFAEGTGNLKDFYNSQAIARKRSITNIGQELRSKLNSGAGMSVDGANQSISALNRIGSIQPYIDSVASALAEGMPLSAKEIASEFYSKFLKGVGALSAQNQFGIYAGEVQRAASLLSQFANLKVPSFAKGVQNFQGGLAMVHGGEMLVNMARGTDVIPKGAVRSQGAAPTTNNYSIAITDRKNPSADITAALLATR